MNEAIITSTVDLTEGGCNACGIIEAVSYTLTVEGREIPLDELSVSSLVMTLVLKNGFSQEMKMDVLDDYLLYKREDIEVKLFEEYDQLSYQTSEKEITSKNYIKDTEALTKQVNEILTTLFRLEKYTFNF